MKLNTRLILGLVAGTAISLLSASTLLAATTVNVSLWDAGDRAMDGLGEMPAMGMAMGGDHNASTMRITTDVSDIPAGEVTFRAKNDSTIYLHEMLVARILSTDAALPYDPEIYRVDEETSGSRGEVSELEVGATGALTLTLEPGTYILFCNIPGHYEMGMWTLVTVH